jgi:hypothetical protein
MKVKSHEDLKGIFWRNVDQAILFKGRNIVTVRHLKRIGRFEFQN